LLEEFTKGTVDRVVTTTMFGERVYPASFYPPGQHARGLSDDVADDQQHLPMAARIAAATCSCR
jgi:hypothetical protein